MAKQLSLAAKYRPQTFQAVAGQGTVKAVLSRASAEDRPACAYLLSGTRGVGKTTIARIFAKALNCANAPAAEPCNECEQCRKITQGNHVDVIEIDGASNNGVDDVRALRETVGYAPMEGRYKIFIVDEAHMLSKAAFNALLKTLEEPPPRVIFIFATTEVHRFPVTIVSRCQHFVFRHLAEEELLAHLRSVLEKEAVPFEEEAVRLLAKRAAGSVRDGMSLLDQTLAMGGNSLTAALTREVLGLAGQELFGQLFGALAARDCVAGADLSAQLLRQGVDMGLFLRELAGQLRNLFLLRQAGPAMVPQLHVTDDEAKFLQSVAAKFSPAHLHAAWQMVLDAQRPVTQNPEPATALELLLLNLALLPQLLPVTDAGLAVPPAPPVPPVSGGPAQPALASSAPEAPAAPQHEPATPAQPQEMPSNPPQRPSQQPEAGPVSGPAPAPAPDAPAPGAPMAAAPADASAGPAAAEPSSPQQARTEAAPEPAPAPDSFVARYAPKPAPSYDWGQFCDYLFSHSVKDRLKITPSLARSCPAVWTEGELRLSPEAHILASDFRTSRSEIEAALRDYVEGPPPRLVIETPPEVQTDAALVEAFNRHEALKPCFDILGARVDRCYRIQRPGKTSEDSKTSEYPEGETHA